MNYWRRCISRIQISYDRDVVETVLNVLNQIDRKKYLVNPYAEVLVEPVRQTPTHTISACYLHFVALCEIYQYIQGVEKTNIRVLDAGCGTGFMSVATYMLGQHLRKKMTVVGVDVNSTVVNHYNIIAEPGYPSVYQKDMDVAMEEQSYDILHGGFMATRPQNEFINWIKHVKKGNMLVLFPLNTPSGPQFTKILFAGNNVNIQYLLSVRYEPQIAHDFFQARSGFAFEDYDRGMHGDYNSVRVPVGLDLIQKELRELEHRKGRRLDILDAGSGTGIYFDGIKKYCRKYVGTDTSEKMLRVLKSRLRASDSVRVENISRIRENDHSFDVVLCNSVIHHLSPQELKGFIAECRRILRPGGLLLLTTTTKRQNRQSWWWKWLIPRTVRRVSDRMHMKRIDDKNFLKLFKNFHLKGAVPLRGETFQSDFWDVHGPLRTQYRNADSTWRLASRRELARGISKLRGADKGGLEKQISKTRRAVDTYGQAVLLIFSNDASTFLF